MASPDVTAIVVNYNGEKWLRRCFHTIAKQSYPKERLRIVVVDNNSTDNSIDYIRKAYRNVVVVNSGSNLGYAGGVNLGYKYADGKYVALMANDIFFPKDWVEKMVASMENNRDCAASTALIVNGEDIGQAKGELLNATPILVGRGDTRNTGYTMIPWGSACVFRKDLFDLPFDSDYFLYGEDVYLGLMSWLKGYKVVDSGISVANLGSVTAGFFSKMQIHYNERNRLTNLLLFFKFKTLAALLPFILVDFFVKNVYFLKTRRPDLVHAELKAFWWNVTNFRKNNRKRHWVQEKREVSDFVMLDVLCENLYGTSGMIKGAINSVFMGYFRAIKKVWSVLKI